MLSSFWMNVEAIFVVVDDNDISKMLLGITTY